MKNQKTEQKAEKNGISYMPSPANDFAPAANGSLKGAVIKLNADNERILKALGQDEIPGSEIMLRLKPWTCKDVAGKMVCLVRKFIQHSPDQPDLTDAQRMIFGIIEARSTGKVDVIVETLGSKGFGIQSLPFELAAMCRKYGALTQSLGLVTLPQSRVHTRTDAFLPSADKE